jgi:hypothetical protein
MMGVMLVPMVRAMIMMSDSVMLMMLLVLMVLLVLHQVSGMSGCGNYFHLSTQRSSMFPVRFRQFHEGHGPIVAVSLGVMVTFRGGHLLHGRNLVDRHGAGEGHCHGRSRSLAARSHYQPSSGITGILVKPLKTEQLVQT